MSKNYPTRNANRIGITLTHRNAFGTFSCEISSRGEIKAKIQTRSTQNVRTRKPLRNVRNKR